MSQDALSRFLQLVERELGGARARIELSLHAPEEGALSAPLPNGFRVVVIGHAPAASELGHARLLALVESFLGGVDDAAFPVAHESPRPVAVALTEALALLARQARAESAWVIDDSTPEIWGGSLPHAGLDVDAALREAEPSTAPSTLDPALQRALRAIAERRGGGSAEGPTIARRFAGIYELVLVFEGAYSELHAEAAIVRGLPWIERLVTSLPPRDPAGKGAKVAVLRRLRRV